MNLAFIFNQFYGFFVRHKLIIVPIGSSTPPGTFKYFRPGGVDVYHRPDGTSLYKRP